MPDECSKENWPLEVTASHDLSTFLGNYAGSPQTGCETAGVEGGFTRIRLRYPHPETGKLCSCQLRPEIVDGRAVIVMDLKEHDITPNERGPWTDYRSP